jgi:hypothetical protein
MKKSLCFLIPILSILVTACADHDLDSSTSFAFGRYYGYCAGDCSDAFVLKNNSLYQSEGEIYPDTDRPWSLPALNSLNNDQKNAVAELPSLLPQSLVDSETNIIGCPDCTDFGAVYIELNQNGHRRFWYIDNATQDQEIKNFISVVHDKITLLTQ